MQILLFYSTYKNLLGFRFIVIPDDDNYLPQQLPPVELPQGLAGWVAVDVLLQQLSSPAISVSLYSGSQQLAETV